MNIYEVLGSCFVVYMVCAGLVAHGWLVIAGVHRVHGRLDIGEQLETEGVRDALGMQAARLEIRRSAN